jgi:23S rRNA (adenine-N6)-dimethyltransferase
VAAANVRPGELVLEVGAGRGALTAPLLDAGARVIAVERHPGRAAWLRERFAGRNVTVVEGDALAMDLPRRAFRVVASPPYAISTPLVRMLLAPGSRMISADLVLQRGAARRFSVDGARGPGARGTARRWDLRLGLPVPRRAFTPPPRVDSVVLLARRR